MENINAPWLVYSHISTRRNRKTLQTFNNVVPIKSFPELRRKTIQASCHGWLVLRHVDNPKMYSLWNVATSQSLTLPPLPYLPTSDNGNERVKLSTCALTSPPFDSSNTNAAYTKTTSCVLALFFQDHVFWCRPSAQNHDARSNDWVTQKLDLNGGRIAIHLSTTVNGILYSWAKVYQPSGGYYNYLVSMTVDEDRNLLILESLDLRRPECGYAYVHITPYLVESCSTLYCVNICIRHGGDDQISVIKVFELDLAARNWVEVKSLDGRAFFLGTDCCTWCWGDSDNDDPTNNLSSTTVGVKGNCVYFLQDYCNILSLYSLAERTVTEFQTFRNLQAPVTSFKWLDVTTERHRLPAIQYSKEHATMTHVHISKDQQKVEDDDMQGCESMLITKLPNNVIQMVSEYLHPFDYINFRATCKTTQSIVLPFPRKGTNNCLTVPMFIFFKTDDGWCQMMDPSRDTCCNNRLQLSLDRFTVDFSKDGWLVIHENELESIKLLNPFTGVLRDFPKDDLSSIQEVRSIGFSTYPNSPGCITVFFDNGYDKSVLIYYIKHGDKEWSECEIENEEDKFWPGKSSPVYFEGAFYILGIDGRLGEFQVTADGDENWYIYESPVTLDPDNPLHSYNLVECDGNLLGVFIGYMGTWVQVFKFKFSKEKWIKVKSLGNYSLFISNPSSFSKQTTEVWMRNRIYVPRLKGDSIVFYSLNTGKFHVVCGSEDDSFEDLFGTSAPLHCFWYS